VVDSDLVFYAKFAAFLIFAVAIAIAWFMTGCGDDAPPVLDASEAELRECLTDDDCSDAGRFGEQYCQECVCVSERTHYAPCWKLGGVE
jgi:hypothetical protein